MALALRGDTQLRAAWCVREVGVAMMSGRVLIQCQAVYVR